MARMILTAWSPCYKVYLFHLVEPKHRPHPTSCASCTEGHAFPQQAMVMARISYVQDISHHCTIQYCSPCFVGSRATGTSLRSSFKGSGKPCDLLFFADSASSELSEGRFFPATSRLWNEGIGREGKTRKSWSRRRVDATKMSSRSRAIFGKFRN